MKWTMRTSIALLLVFACGIAEARPVDADADFSAFLSRWREAIVANDAEAVAGMTQVPFLFEGEPRDRADVARTVVPALLTSDVRRCLHTAPPLREDDRYVLSCVPYLFYLGRIDGQWRWVEFAADGEG
ncbi:hypothetical protein [Pseudoxanthomonas sp. Root630]|uniref:hypothetical protein n=1 Tax=Pseudoxanthomonas sp. Root630 TaxID=1736574 RepID=UPI000703AC05|nr:hypothetical protein [Pseudoxanthomonas sp. Root630]KRA46259.1 hypothetical protein ASD72_03315 [Pseudoxanthomonas sp. Root630]